MSDALREAAKIFRDVILNERGLISENGMTSDQINDVLNEFDKAFGAALAQPKAQEPQPELCCGDYATCGRPCTHRGIWLADQSKAQEPTEYLVEAEWPDRFGVPLEVTQVHDLGNGKVGIRVKPHESREQIRCWIRSAARAQPKAQELYGSDFEKIKFIQRVLDEEVPTEQDRLTAHGMATDLRNKIWNADQPKEQETDYKTLYNELLYAVVRVHPDETRHQTALRYIRLMEAGLVMGGIAAAPKEKP
jgi:hypothetical protein